MKILGISAYYHDSAAALISNGIVVSAVQEERFTRKKHDPSFPTNAVRWILEENGITLNDIAAVVFYDKPWLKFERILETYYGVAPKGFQSFRKFMPQWMKEKIFLSGMLKKELSTIDAKSDLKKIKLLFSEHHLSHAASTYYPSGYEESAILTIDGVGEWATTSLAYGKGTDIRILKELRFPHSLGLLYSAFTYFLGFKVNSGEYKVMGLAPYGSVSSKEYPVFRKKILNEIVHVFDDGSIWLNQKYFNYMKGLTMIEESLWENLFGIKKRTPEEELNELHCHLALAIQHITEEAILKMAGTLKKITQSDNLCLAGGVALNCVANGKLQDSGLFKNIYITPAAGDAGGAQGCALAAYYLYFKKERTTEAKGEPLNGSLLGPDFDNKDVERVIKKFNAVAHKLPYEELLPLIARQIADGKISGWFQHKMEFGPRALGCRSILADPRNQEMQKLLNLKIKFREGFRPFAASVLEEDASDFFHLHTPSPYMLLVKKVREKWLIPVPENYYTLPLKEKLYTPRSHLPAITHVDFSCRIQTVNQRTNPLYYALLNEFKKITGIGILVNTSFNVRGEPIVCNPEEAYTCFMRTEMDLLVINNYLFLKDEQKPWQENESWKEILNKD